MNQFAESWGWFAGEVHDLAREKGWWETDRSFLECMGLVISELGEAVIAKHAYNKSRSYRHGQKQY